MAEAAGKDPEFEALTPRLARLTGWDLGRFKENYLRRRVDGRRRALGAGSWEAYAEALASDPDELGRLKERLTVHVTEFLRDPDLWRALERSFIAPLLFAAALRPIKELRLWSAGCSSGEEAYSLAMLALRGARLQGRGVRVRVLASDLDRGVLDRARAGRFSAAALRLVDPRWIDEFFVPDGRGWAVGDELKNAVAFRQMDLFSSPPALGVDLLLCRNVMIYFSKDTQQRLMRSFHTALRPGGIFVTGKTETILGPARDRFRCLSASERVFQRV
ncbi:MAG TPA: protein-glutamate O-methyltransferase CheR [bacterium]|nr:protein-glutamate O-methyltransferase CheR [bacterium]